MNELPNLQPFARGLWGEVDNPKSIISRFVNNAKNDRCLKILIGCLFWEMMGAGWGAYCPKITIDS